MRPDDPLPIAIASFRVAVPRASLAQRVLAAAANGERPARRCRRAWPMRSRSAASFMATAYMHDQWGREHPGPSRSRRAPSCSTSASTSPIPERRCPTPSRSTSATAEGFVEAAFGELLAATYPTGDSAEVAVRCTYGDEALEARMTLAISDDPAPPARRRHLAAAGAGARRQARRAGRGLGLPRPGPHGDRQPRDPRRGVPRGPPCDYMYELLNASGMVDALHAAGYDVIIVGLDNGLTTIQRNAQVLVQCIREARKRTPQPLVVGGVSMGGLVSRYALAWMEKQGEDHGTRTLPEHRRAAPRDLHEPRRAVVRPRARARTRRVCWASRGCSTRRPTCSS